jgi:hypothetical protein
MDAQLPPHRPVLAAVAIIFVIAMTAVALVNQGIEDMITECIVELTAKRPKAPNRGMIRPMGEFVTAYVCAHASEVEPLLHERFAKQMDSGTAAIVIAETLTKLLETTDEMRTEAEHESLWQLWNDTLHHSHA